MFFWAASVDFPVIIVQPHRIEEINEYVGERKLQMAIYHSVKIQHEKHVTKVQGVCMGEGQVSVFVKLHSKMCNKNSCRVVSKCRTKE